MSRGTPFTLFLAGAAMLAGAGCGRGGGDLASGVIHLDPRLAGGSSPSAALADTLAALEIRPDAGDAASLGAWHLEHGKLEAAAGGGARLVRDGADAAASLVLAGPLEASLYDSLELVAHTRVATDVRVAWKSDAGEDALVLPLNPGERPRRVAFALSNSPAWTGTVRVLTVTPSQEGQGPVAVDALRLMPTGFEWGFEPLEQERVARELGGARGDAGLRGTGRMTRRAWPADLGVPLLDKVERVPRGAVLATAVAPSTRAIAAAETVFAAVDARRDGGEWKRLALVEVPPRRGAWLPVRVDLAGYGGDALELRFLASASRDEAAPDSERTTKGAPSEEHVLWGAPEILGELPTSRRPNLVLITLDTTRADALGAGDPVFAPFLARLGDEALVFTDAWSACNATSPSHASLLTGLHVEEHGVTSNRHLLAPELLTIAESLRALGYHTAAAVSVPHLQAGTGFGQGFDEFALAPPGAELDGAIAVDAVEHMLAEWSTLPDRPFFLWVHLFDPHTPYAPPAAFVDEFLARTGLERPLRKVDPPTVPVWAEDSRELDEIPFHARWGAGVTSLDSVRFSYHLGVAYADHLSERLYDALAGRGLLEQTGLILTGDHGESLGEHNVWFDHAGLFRETLGVPLYVRPPGPAQPGRRIDTRSTGLDIVPTLRALAGLPANPALAGVDLIALARGDVEAPRDRRVYFTFSDMHQLGFHDAETHFFTTLTDRLRLGTALVIENGRTVPKRGEFIAKGRGFLYDPVEDPGLTHDVAAERPAEAASALELLERWRAHLDRGRSERRAVSADEEEGLRNMGYTGD